MLFKVHFPNKKYVPEGSKVPETQFEAGQVALESSCKYKQSKTVWNCVYSVMKIKQWTFVSSYENYFPQTL